MKTNRYLILLFIFFNAFIVYADVIKEIRLTDLQGNPIDASSVMAYTRLSIGDEIINEKSLINNITRDTNELKNSDRFSYVDSSLLIEDDGYVIIYKIIPKNRLRKIEIRGANNINPKKIIEKSELKLGDLIDDSSIELSIQKIKKAYVDYWYPDVQVKWAYNKNNSLGVIDLVLEINEGSKIGIDEVVFNGNVLINDRDLKSIIRQNEKGLLSFITDAGRYHPEFIDSDLSSLKAFYMNQGFLDVEIQRPTVNKKIPIKSKINYQIIEGRHYQIGEYFINGVNSFDKNEIMNRIILNSGEKASRQKINQVSEIIKSYYGNRGFISTKVEINYDANPSTGIVNINYLVNEGEKGITRDVVITGNKKTLDEVIRRELVILPGDEYNTSKLRASKNRLLNLNYFKTVNIDTQLIDSKGSYDVLVKVDEKPTGQFNAGIGMSSMDSLIGYIDVSQGNFNIKKWPPIGGGQKFQVRLQAGSRRNDLEFSFSEPWFLDQKLAFGVNAYHREARYFSEVYDQINDGIKVSLGQPINRDSRHSVSYKIEQYEVKNASQAPQFIQDEEAKGKTISSGIEYLFSYDTRNKSFGSNKGNKTIFSPYINGGILGGETDIYGLRAKTTQFFPLIWDMTFVARIQFSAVDTYGDSNSVPIFDKLFLGGTYTLRGYDYRDIGPREIDLSSNTITSNESIGGLTSAFASTELTFPIWDKVRGAIFYDWGLVNEQSWDFDTSFYNDNYGVGLRIELPGFPLQLDYGWPIHYNEIERGESGKPKFNFLMGYVY